MVRSGGKPYRTEAQRNGGGKTRREQLGDKLKSKRRRLRENNLKELRFHTKPTKMSIHDPNYWAVYGIYRDGSEWVLTGLSFSDRQERLNNHRGGGYSDMKVKERRIADTHPSNGIEINRFDKKKQAMNHISADGSEMVESGAYLIRPQHNPRSRTEEVDQQEYDDFRRYGRKVYDDNNLQG